LENHEKWFPEDAVSDDAPEGILYSLKARSNCIKILFIINKAWHENGGI
jgi:hypothetical protein